MSVQPLTWDHNGPGQDQMPDTNLSQYFYAPHSYMSHVLTSTTRGPEREPGDQTAFNAQLE